MSIDINRVTQIISQLNEAEQQTVFEFACYLVSKKQDHFNMESFFEDLPEDDETLSPEETARLSQPDEFVSWEDVKRELQIDCDPK